MGRVMRRILFFSDSPHGSGDSNWNWYGTDAEQVAQLKKTVALEDTDYATWTPSTTSLTLETIDVEFEPDKDNYQYCCVEEFDFNPVYNSGTEVKCGVTKYIGVVNVYYVLLPASKTEWNNGNKSATGTLTAGSRLYCFYKDSNGEDKTAVSGAAGVYPATATVNSSLTSTYYRATINAKCNTSYFSTAMAAAIDQHNSKYTIKMTVYRVPIDKSYDVFVDQLIDVYQNGVS